MDLRPYIEKFARRLAEVESALSDPGAFDQKQRAQELAREYSRLKELVSTGTAYTQTLGYQGKPLRHQGGDNYIFSDGHARWFKGESIRDKVWFPDGQTATEAKVP